MREGCTWTRLRLEADLALGAPLLRDLSPPERWCLIAGVLPLAAYSPFKGRLLVAERAPVDAAFVADTAGVPTRVATSLFRTLQARGALHWDPEFNCWYVGDLGFYWDRANTGEARWKRDRYERFASAAGCFTEAQVAARVAFYGGLCWICRAAPYEALDHVKPLARGGSNWPANLRPACHPCNSRKGARWPFTPPALVAA
jgi:5-methylcytosine-specific restriction endonuclease McrA